MGDTEFRDINILLQEQEYYNEMVLITLEAMNSLETYEPDYDDDLPF